MIAFIPAASYAGGFWEQIFKQHETVHQPKIIRTKPGFNIKTGLTKIVAESAARNGVPVVLVHRIIAVESRGKCNADNGIAHGPMQVQTATAHSVGVYGNLHNCSTGIEAGVRYLRLALNKSHGNWSYAATLYNRGLGARPSRSQYASLVMKN